MKLVFNELSLGEEQIDMNRGRDVIEQFITAYSAAIGVEYGFEREVSTCVDFNSIYIAKDYPISKWRNEPDIDRDLKRRFIGMCDKQDLTDFVEDEAELKCEEGQSKGLLAAYENQAVCISMSYNTYWNDFYIKCEYYSLIEDSTSNVIVQNISSRDTLSNYSEEIRKLRRREAEVIRNPQQFIEKLNVLFPSLVFHQTAINQLKREIQAQHMSIICNKLLELEKYFSKWKEGAFDSSCFPVRSVSPQSKETLNKFKKEHTYQFGNKEIIVSYHMRYTGNIPGRIYFYPDTAERKALICSLTTKLPTVTNPKLHV